MDRRSFLLRDEDGQTLPLIVVFVLGLLLTCGLVIDLGNAYRVRQALQASTDAAAAAGAGTLTLSYPANGANASAAAQAYGSTASGQNDIGGVPASNVSETVGTSCHSYNPNLPCAAPNTVDVTQTAQIPTYFLSLLGWQTLTVSAHAQACSPCGDVPLDIQLVIDRTGSMAANNKITNLINGLQQGFLIGLDPAVDNVGLTLLPPDRSGTSDVCNAQNGGSYNITNPTYTVVRLENTYMMNRSLNQADALISDINCLRPGGSTDYANALEAADAELNMDGRPGVQKVIVLLSDGAANTGQNCSTASSDPHCTQPCHTAVNDAATYKANHVLVYSILYGDQTGGPACQDSTGANEAPFMQPWTAMQQIASPGNYYPDPNPTDLTSVFERITADMAAGTSRITQ